MCISKKRQNMLIGIVMIMLLTGCSANNVPQGEAELSTQVQTEIPINVNENNLIDKFLSGEVNAEGNGLYVESFNISELPMNEEWDSYSIGDRIDLDNDGEEELILNGPYGGMYLDCSDDTIKVFASGDGTASNLSYVCCDNEVWIVHSDTMHSDREYYRLEKYSGADNITDSVVLEIYEQAETGRKEYYLNGNKVSDLEYNEVYQTFFLDDKAYIGEYLDYDVSEPNLEIAKGEDGKYIVQIGIYRLATLSDGVGELTAEGMNFTATDPAGNPISGVITIEDKIANVTFTNSTWTYLENGSTFEYTKSSDTSNIWSE